MMKNKRMIGIGLFCAGMMLVLMPFSVAAQNPPVPGGENEPEKLLNPLCAEGSADCVQTLDGLILKVVNVLVGISYAVAAFFLLLSGFRFVMAQGNQEKLKGAKDTFRFTIIGVIIIVAFQVIINVIQEVVGAVAS